MQQKGECNLNKSNIMSDSIQNDIDEDEISTLQALILEYSSSNNLEYHMIAYTAAVLQNDIIKGKWHWQLKCEECLRVFSEDQFIDDELVNMKMNTKNLRPVAKSTFDICLGAQKLMERFNYEPENYEKIPIELLRVLNINDLFSYSDFGSHCETNHKPRLVELIIKMYIKKQQTYISKCNTLELHDVLLRRKLNKIIHFKGQ